MNILSKYVDYAQPVVKTVNKNHNDFFRLQYFMFKPEDLRLYGDLVDFMHDGGYLPEHFNGVIPCIYAQWGEETGASMVLELSAEHRKLLNKDLATTLLGEHYKKWEDGVVYLLMDHEYCDYDSGFKVVEQIDPTKGDVWDALAFISRRIGLSYLVEHDGDLLEYTLT